MQQWDKGARRKGIDILGRTLSLNDSDQRTDDENEENGHNLAGFICRRLMEL